MDLCCSSRPDHAETSISVHRSEEGCTAVGCCSPTEAVPHQSEEGFSRKSEGDCADGCCSSAQPPARASLRKPEDSCTSDCCVSLPTEPVNPKSDDSCADGCCSAPPPINVSPRKSEDSCSSLPTGAPTDHCCSSPAPTQANSKDCTRTACQEAGSGTGKKKAQCCDDGCLDEITRREFSEKCSKEPTECGDACEHHKKKARSQYQASLEALGCICRTLLAMNLESCCNKTTIRRRRGRQGERSRSTASLYSKEDSAGRIRSTEPIRNSCMQGCLVQGETDSKPVSANASLVDVERGDVKNERVILTVKGMTCTGCETKLTRSLNSLPAMTRVQTSLLLSRAEFDIDSRILSAEQVQVRLEKETGFKFERVRNENEELEVIEVLAGGDAEAFLTREMPPGVVGTSIVDKDTVTLQYDPKIIGARDLVNHAFSPPLQLAPHRAPPSIASGRKHVWDVGRTTVISALLTIPVLVIAWTPLSEHELAYGDASLALATIVQVAIAGPFYLSALRSLIFFRVIEMDLLIVLSTTTAYVFSVVAFAYIVIGHPLPTGEFFETSTLLITLIMVGRFLSALAHQKAVKSVSIRSLQAPTTLVSSDNRTYEEIDARLLQFGDIFKVLSETSSEVDESIITSESKLIPKESRSPVIAASVNGSGTLFARLLRSNTDLADKIAGYFVPIIITITLVVCPVQATTYTIATLIVSCPCAIRLAVAIVIVVASGIAAQHGVVAKTAETLEIARKTTHVVLDKTGTLTQGNLSVCREIVLEGFDEPVTQILFALVRASKHPVSIAVAAHFEKNGAVEAKIENIQSLPGKGMEASIEGAVIRAGNSHWLGMETDPTLTPLLSQDLTVFCATINGAPRAVYALQDTLRPEARAVISSLAASNIAVSIVSGDDAGPVSATNTRARCSPRDKQAYIQQLHQANPNAVILFCGDGTNDTPAFAQAQIGVHMSSGTAVAASAADACNFAWAALYNAAAVLLAAGAFPRARVVSVLPVVAVGVQLRLVRGIVLDGDGLGVLDTYVRSITQSLFTRCMPKHALPSPHHHIDAPTTTSTTNLSSPSSATGDGACLPESQKHADNTITSIQRSQNNTHCTHCTHYTRLTHTRLAKTTR
ncbi:uncharacterized protein K452DRAFT_348181 [Aplosporella prunicola CBS 121167]|uniref:HMA domain-containing protein n=1 Tax=Aplosporella prunicola CBS 121167 TaxID=1176127 RepID=A0A6A6BTN2_9PEZI|nr:uncharacterized protein K452DRAFT_348181 [Aplosporella prunicola CBS 121167]KAF2147489.1 hypothetical protein K452DRAFT_348181 [Aplosporella prunicola CBS 121167]